MPDFVSSNKLHLKIASALQIIRFYLARDRITLSNTPEKPPKSLHSPLQLRMRNSYQHLQYGIFSQTRKKKVHEIVKDSSNVYGQSLTNTSFFQTTYRFSLNEGKTQNNTSNQPPSDSTQRTTLSESK